MRCVIYRRVSTDMQAEQGYSLDAQEQRLKAYAESQGWTITNDYCDEGYSAKNTDRPELQRMVDDMKNDKFDVILVYKLDRFVRSVLDLHKLLQIMDQYNVKFKSATEVFDTTSATGRLFITLIATLAQWERETIAERVHMGMLKKVENGERNGAKAPFGYDSETGGRLIKNNEEAKWVYYIFNRYQKVGSSTIAKDLNKKGIKTKKGDNWSDFSVRYILANPIYCGYVRWNHQSLSGGKRKLTGKEVIVPFQQDNFEPIINKELFDEIQELAKIRSSIAFRSDNFYPYSHIAKCEKCGYGFSGAFKKLKSGKIHRFYKCRGRINFGVCDTQAISEEVIDNAFLSVLSVMNSDIEVEDENDIDINELNRQLKLIEKKRERTEDLYIAGDISKKRYQQIIENLRVDEHELLHQIEFSSNRVSKELVIETLNNIKSEWHNMSFENRKAALQHLFKSITLRLESPADPGRQIKAAVSIVDYELL